MTQEISERMPAVLLSHFVSVKSEILVKASAIPRSRIWRAAMNASTFMKPGQTSSGFVRIDVVTTGTASWPSAIVEKKNQYPINSHIKIPFMLGSVGVPFRNRLDRTIDEAEYCVKFAGYDTHLLNVPIDRIVLVLDLTLNG